MHKKDCPYYLEEDESIDFADKRNDHNIWATAHRLLCTCENPRIRSYLSYSTGDIMEVTDCD